MDSCETVSPSPELQGLVWGLLYAGAEAVMARLWPVDDHAAKSMASVFYREWRPGTSPMQAYRRAIRHVRGRRQFANPYYWAPFVLFGDGFSPL